MTTHTAEPEKRYVCLHRVIERGDATDETWAELSRVCYQLGHTSEAIERAKHIASPELRHHTELFLVNRGVLERPSEIHRQRAAAQRIQEDRGPFQEEVSDAFGYLFLDHMPFTVMAVTLVFPLVLGLGGFLTSGTDVWVLPAVACIPVLCGLGLVGALARQILLEGSTGMVEAPNIPELSVLSRDAARFLQDALVVFTALLAPGVFAWIVKGPPSVWIPLLATGAVLLPMALALSQVRNDLKGLAPLLLASAAWRCGTNYLTTVIVAAILFAPAVAAGMLTTGSELYLRISFVAPLAIAPLFVIARLMGRVLYLNKPRIRHLLHRIPIAAPATQEPARSAEAEEPRRVDTREPRMERPRHPQGGRRSQRMGRLDAPKHPETRQPATSQKPRARTAPKFEIELEEINDPQPVSARSTLGLPNVLGDELPDLSNMPGARVLRGAERDHAGASTRPRPQ